QAVAQEGDRVLAHVVVLVGVPGDADRVHAPLAGERERARERVAQLGPAAGGGGTRLGPVEDPVEMDVGDVQQLHGADSQVYERCRLSSGPAYRCVARRHNLDTIPARVATDT